MSFYKVLEKLEERLRNTPSLFLLGCNPSSHLPCSRRQFTLVFSQACLVIGKQSQYDNTDALNECFYIFESQPLSSFLSPLPTTSFRELCSNSKSSLNLESLEAIMLLITAVTLFLQFQGMNCQVTTAIPMPTTAVTLAEKVLNAQRLIITPGTIDFQVGPCELLLNGPPPGEDPNIPGSPAGDQVRLFYVRRCFLGSEESQA